MLKTTLPKVSKVATSTLLIYAGVKGTIYGSELQEQALNKLRNYDWMQGHLGDFCLPMAWAAASHYVHKDKWMQVIFALIPPVIGTVNKIFDPLLGKSNYVDLTDIAMYWSGTAAGWYGPKLAETVTASVQEAIFPDQFRNHYMKR